MAGRLPTAPSPSDLMNPDTAVRLAAALVTPRLRLEPLSADHAAALFPILSDARTHRWIPPLRSDSVATLRARWARLESRFEAGEARLAWALHRASDAALVGKLDADVDADWVATNVGYVLAPEVWGQGLATEAVGAVVEHLVRSGVRELRATVTVGNVASCRVLEKHGFVCQGRLIGSETLRGEPHDDWRYVRVEPSSGGAGRGH